LGRDLEAAIDISPAMARKILNKNGSVMYRTSVRPLTPDEIQYPTEKKEHEEFGITIEKKFEESVSPTYQEIRCHMIFDVKNGRLLPQGEVCCRWAHN
jgi:hypothetical protein